MILSNIIYELMTTKAESGIHDRCLLLFRAHVEWNRKVLVSNSLTKNTS